MTAADVLRVQLEAVGGLVSRGRLALDWGWSRTYTNAMTKRPDFPAPVCNVEGRPLYARTETDAWKATYDAARAVPA